MWLGVGGTPGQEVQQGNDAFMTRPHREEVDSVNDPFMTHHRKSQPAQSAQSASSSPAMRTAGPQADLQHDPFLSHASRQLPLAAQPGPQADLHRDPFLARALPMYSASGMPLPPGRFKLLRDELGGVAAKVYVLVPWVVYVWYLLIWVTLRHYSLSAAWALTCIGLIAIVMVMVQRKFASRGGTAVVSALILGSLCLVATLAGAGTGVVLWELSWRQMWWDHTMRWSIGVTADTPALLNADASALTFVPGEGRVDYARSVGYKDGATLYCVAPVLSPSVAGTEVPRVNYWAYGFDCCAITGSFYCDDSRSYLGQHAVVSAGGSSLFPGEEPAYDYYLRAAVAKASAAHDLVSGRGALFVRWVEDPNQVRGTTRLLAGVYFFASVVGALLIFLLIGTLAAFYAAVAAKQASEAKALAADQSVEDSSCSKCAGKGKLGSVPCEVCNGTGEAVWQNVGPTRRHFVKKSHGGGPVNGYGTLAPPA